MNEDQYTIESGHLDVGDGHKIYYQRWGNPDATPTFYLHGGPGAGCKDKDKSRFDPEKDQVVFHDQRGCGQSTPFGKLDKNESDKLISDIEELRKKFGFKKVQLVGGSWGSCLSFLYAIEHPENVSKMLNWGIYTGRKKENDHLQQGGLASHFPDSWGEYFSVVPDEEKSNTVSYYLKKMQDDNQDVADDHVRRWFVNEAIACVIDPDLKRMKYANQELDDTARSLALLEAHYFANNMFIPENYILASATQLSKIPSVFVQGRFDHVCPPETAYELAEAIGSNCKLHIVPGGHSSGESTMREVIRAYLKTFLD